MTKKLKVIFASLLCACVAATLCMTACGEDGVTPQIGDNGNWYIGETDTGVRAEGKQGEQGVGVKNITINAEGKLVITLSNDEVITLGKVVGEDGAAGKGVKSFEINGEGKLVVTYSDDTTETSDKVVGNDGRSITGAHVDDEGKLVLEFNEGDNVTAGDVKGVGIKNIEIVEGKFKITMTDDEVIELDIPKSVHIHNWVSDKEVAATCTSIGYTQYTCNVDDCTELKYEFTDATGHTFNKEPDFEIPAATCKDKGLKVFTCSVCGATKDEFTVGEHNYEGGKCTYCQAPEPGQSFKLNVTAADRYAEITIPEDIQGVHIIEADLGDTTLSTGRLQCHVYQKTENSELVFSQSRSSDHHNVYFGYINLADGASKITFEAIGEDVSADIFIKDYDMPTLKTDGTPVEVPVNLYGKSDLKFKIDNTVEVKAYTLNITCTADTQAWQSSNSPRLRLKTGSTNICAMINKVSNISVSLTNDLLSTLGSESYLLYFDIAVSSVAAPEIFPITVTLTAAS